MKWRWNHSYELFNISYLFFIKWTVTVNKSKNIQEFHNFFIEFLLLDLCYEIYIEIITKYEV